MRVSNFPLYTLKETPSDAEITSHQLMLRAGMIRKLGSGLYTWLPLGYRILRKVENIIREEMDKSGALEVLMPTIHPAELWQESTRWEQYGPELLRLKDRHDREYCYGPTHEEVITDFAKRELSSYKQLPINYYQIQLKFRDEIRPRFGVMRSREFIMKDAYSFHIDHASLDETYQVMYQTYSNIFTRLGLDFRAVAADSGAIGGNKSQEFHVLADSGEDAIAHSTVSDYAANIQLAEALALGSYKPGNKPLKLEETPNVCSIKEVSEFFNSPEDKCLKTLLVKGVEDTIVALVLRGDHQLNEIKTEKLEEVQAPLEFIEAETITQKYKCEPGSIGPINLDATIIADRSALNVSDFICGANQTHKHYSGANWERDLPKPKVADLRNVIEGDASPDGEGTLKIVRGIEVGHIFQLGDKYSKSMQAEVLDKNGRSTHMQMGCYGIGVTRVVAAAIEQNHDERGIIWPNPIAPFDLALIPINAHKSASVQETTERYYQLLSSKGYEVLLDDRDARPGFKFADMELIGIPHRFVISEKSLDKNIVEYKSRDGACEENIDLQELENYIDQLIPR